LVFGWSGTIFATRVTIRKLFGLGPPPAALFGRALAGAFARLGGGCLKLGQILSSRIDLLPEEALVPLRRLQDSVAPVAPSRVRRILERSLGCCPVEVFSEFEERPIASASIAQVHRAVLRSTGEAVAIKVKRPAVAEQIAADVRLITWGTHLLTCLPWFSDLPLREAVAEVTRSLANQTDFTREVVNMTRFAEAFRENTRVLIPRPATEHCTSEVITMEFVPAVGKITDDCFDPGRQKAAVSTALRTLYRMIFNIGCFHCDLHPGNILLTRCGRVALVDFGFVAEFAEVDRKAFSEFFLAITFRDGRRAAEVVRATALQVGTTHDPVAFELDMTRLVASCAGKEAGRFQIVRFVTELFAVQRRHALYGSPKFTLAILALLTYEGAIKQLDPNLDFQGEAVPYVLSALASFRESSEM
jgi:ubiquinone biosynthesis protein